MMRIKEVLKEKGWTYKMLADALGISEQSVKKTLNSEHITTRTAKNIAEALEVPFWTLFVSREEVLGEDITALVKCGDEYYHARTLDELEQVVETIRELVDKSDTKTE